MLACETRRALRLARRHELSHPSIALRSTRTTWAAGHDAARGGSRVEAQWAQRSSDGRRARHARSVGPAAVASGVRGEGGMRARDSKNAKARVSLQRHQKFTTLYSIQGLGVHTEEGRADV